MRILNVGGDAFFPQASGGLQVCLNELTLALKQLDHEPTLFVALWGGQFAMRSRIAMRLTAKPWVHHRWNAFDVYRAWEPWLHARKIYDLIKPHAIIVQGTKHTAKIAQAFLELGVPLGFYFHDVSFGILGGDVRKM